MNTKTSLALIGVALVGVALLGDTAAKFVGTQNTITPILNQKAPPCINGNGQVAPYCINTTITGYCINGDCYSYGVQTQNQNQNQNSYNWGMMGRGGFGCGIGRLR